MQNINFHLAYLLTKHECVIIPDFGALVISRYPSEKSKESGIFLAPKVILGFNPEIKHNDGLLANSLVKEKDITYKEACTQIQEYSNHLRLSLNTNKPVEIDWVGTFFLSSDNKIIFKPVSNPSCNVSNYGFTNFYFPLLAEVQESVSVESSQEEKISEQATVVPLRKKIITYTGGIAAALIGLFLITSPLDNISQRIIPQNAGMIPMSVTQTQMPQTAEILLEIETAEVLSENVADPEPEIEAVPEEILSAKEETIEVKEEIKRQPVNQRYYFIVVASLPTKDTARETLKRFQREGFKDAAIISEEGKHRIYINYFEEKSDAETFLKRFREDNPKYAKSWLLGQRATL